MGLEDWPSCCQRAYELSFYGWLRSNWAEMNATMSGSINADLHRLMPELGKMLSECRVVLRVVNRPALFNAHAVEETCTAGHQIRIGFVSSNLLFYVWRLFMILGSAGLSAETEEAGVRFRLRPPNDKDAVQLRVAHAKYLSVNVPDREGLDELVDRFEEAPGAHQSMITNLSSLAQQFIAMHEIAHLLPFTQIDRAVDLRSWPLSHDRAKHWHSEICADLSSAEMLLIGIGSCFAENSGLLTPSDKTEGDGGIDDLAQSKLAHDVRAAAFELLAASVSGVYKVQSIADRVQTPLRARPLSPVVHPRFATHPPIPLRRSFFDQWIRQRTSGSQTAFTGAMALMIDQWFGSLAALTFDARQDC